MNDLSISNNYKFCKSFSYYSAIFAIVLGALALVGWTFDITFFKSILPKFSSMNPTTAVCFILLGGSLLIRYSFRDNTVQHLIAVICSLLVLFVAVSRLGNIIFNFDFSPDRLFFIEKLGKNHIAPNTAFNFLLLSTAQLSLGYPKNLFRHAFVMVAGMCSFMALVGYAYDVHALYEMPAFISMALNTATAFFILSCGMLCLEPDYGFINILTNEGISGVMARQLVPRSIIALVILGWLRLMGQRLRLYNPEIGVLVFLFFVIIVFIVLIWQNALLLERVDLERQEKTKELERLNKELQQLDVLKNDFVNNVSHELRTPLTVIKEIVALLYDGTLGPILPKQKDLLETAKRNVDRLARMIDNSLDYQKLDAKKVEYNTALWDINLVVKEVGEGFKMLSAHKGLHLEFQLQSDLPLIKFDNDKIVQVLTNLLNNAIKFTAKGNIYLMTEKEGSNAVKVSIKDEGIGVKEEDLNKLFQAFSQISSSVGYHVGGTGLGLALCKKIIEGHQGKIGVVSEFGQGSTFYFILPIEERRISD